MGENDNIPQWEEPAQVQHDIFAVSTFSVHMLVAVHACAVESDKAHCPLVAGQGNYNLKICIHSRVTERKPACKQDTPLLC